MKGFLTTVMAIKHTALHHKNTQNVSLRFAFHAAAKIHLFKQTLQFVLTRSLHERQTAKKFARRLIVEYKLNHLRLSTLFLQRLKIYLGHVIDKELFSTFQLRK